MGTWQLFVDESGDFESATCDLAVVGFLLQGYASPQLSALLRQSVERIFPGIPYPPHAAHHNCASSLLWAPVRGATPPGTSERFHQRTAAAVRLALEATSPAAADFRDAVARSDAPRRLDLGRARDFDRWLAGSAPAAHQSVVAEADQQRADFVDFLDAQLGRTTAARSAAVVAAWRGAAAGHASANATYHELYETLIERALAFVATRDSESQLWVHVAKREGGDDASRRGLESAQKAAASHPMLDRARSRPAIQVASLQRYDHGVHAGVVVADFAANRLRGRVLGHARGWDEVARSCRATIGLAPGARCELLSAADNLPAITPAGDARAAIRDAAAGAAATIPAGPRWAREQVQSWLAAIQGAPR